MKFKCIGVWMMSAALFLSPVTTAWGAFGEDVERPKPVFRADGGDWVAELIPRGKSTSIKIRFNVSGGVLEEPASTEFSEKEMPTNIDLKNYRSGFFGLQIVPTNPGGEVTVSISSDYFNSGTDVWGWNDRKVRTWNTVGIENVQDEQKNNTLSFKVRDGDLLDEDGSSNGRIQLIVGPRDSFWGYAIGTLLIRFFGVFLVLAVMEIGMIVSGRVFQSMEKKAALVHSTEVPVLPDEAGEEESAPVELPASLAAAIAMALHLHTKSGPKLYLADAHTGSAWSEFGRSQCMADRMSAFDRIQRN